MANAGEIKKSIRGLQTLLPVAKASGLDIGGIPDSESLYATTNFLEEMDLAPVVVGERDDTEWKIVGTLDKEWIPSNAQFDGPYRVIGKVRKTIETGQWHFLASLPGFNFLSREESVR